MKKCLALILGAAMVLSGCGGSSSSSADAASSNNTLKLYNWGEYMGEDFISNFEKEYDAKVICEYFDSNEMMYTKVQAGDKYDVLVPSDYMIERLMNEDLLQPINKDEIPNMENLADGVKNLDYDPDNTYSVPYFWGNVGIVYDKNNVSEADLKKEGWNILKDERYKGDEYIYDSERDSFMMAFKALGYSMNTDNEDEINAAYEWLLELNNTMEPAYVTDEVIDNMANGLMDMAVVYSGDAAYVLSENEDMSYSMPEEGTNIWVDSMVIPENAANPKLAHEFINYILSYDASYDNSETVGYASTNKDVLADMSGKGGEYEGNEAYLPRDNYAKDEVFRDNEFLRQKLSELWIKVKASK